MEMFTVFYLVDLTEIYLGSILRPPLTPISIHQSKTNRYCTCILIVHFIQEYFFTTIFITVITAGVVCENLYIFLQTFN